MRSIKNTILITLLLSSISYPSYASGGTTVYPPTNEAAGSGLLYFPAGGNSSLYAVPVLSDDLTTAVKELKDAVSKSSGVQCFAVSGYIACVNTVTGMYSARDLSGNGIPELRELAGHIQIP